MERRHKRSSRSSRYILIHPRLIPGGNASVKSGSRANTCAFRIYKASVNDEYVNVTIFIVSVFDTDFYIRKIVNADSRRIYDKIYNRFIEVKIFYVYQSITFNLGARLYIEINALMPNFCGVMAITAVTRNHGIVIFKKVRTLPDA